MSSTSIDKAIGGIRRLIATRALRSGDRLPPERELAEQLGVARPTVREAVKRLNGSGLLESRARSGTYVASVDLQALAEVRMRLEPLAARLAAERRSKAELAQIRSMLSEMRRRLPDPAAFSEFDVRLHSAIWNASRNAMLIDLLERLLEPGRLSRSVTSSSEAARQAALTHLTTLVAAIRRRDPDLAERAMSSHLKQVEGESAGTHLSRPSSRKATAGASHPT